MYFKQHKKPPIIFFADYSCSSPCSAATDLVMSMFPSEIQFTINIKFLFSDHEKLLPLYIKHRCMRNLFGVIGAFGTANFYLKFYLQISGENWRKILFQRATLQARFIALRYMVDENMMK